MAIINSDNLNYLQAIISFKDTSDLRTSQNKMLKLMLNDMYIGVNATIK